MWKWLTDGDSSWLLSTLIQISVAALLLYAARSGHNCLFFSIPIGTLLLGGAAVRFGGPSGVRLRYSPVRRHWRNRQER